MTAALATPAGQQVYTLASMTAVRVGEETEGLDALPSFVGAAAIVLSTDVGGAQIAGRVDILVFPAAGTVGAGATTGQEGSSGVSGGGHSGVGPCSECGSAAGTGPGGAGGGNSGSSGGGHEGGGRS